MKKYALAATVLTIAASGAHAGGLDRSFTPTDIIYEKGNYAEFSFGYTAPDVTGSDLLGNRISNVANNYGIVGAGLKMNFGGPLSFALIFDQPYGADVQYGGSAATTLLGGTMADADSNAITALLHYRFNDRISIFGGPRMVQAKGRITLSGLAYGPANGSKFQFHSDDGVGGVIGGAYEIPSIAFRASATYHTSINLNMVTTETIPVAAGGPGVPISVGKTNSKLPETIKIALQSGIAKNTLVFGSYRHSKWKSFSLTPPAFGINLAQLDNVETWELGVGHRFNDKFSASVAVSYEDGGSDNLVSPLAPTNGMTAVTIGGKYKINDTITLSGGVRYTWLGNALPETGTPDTARGTFKNNNALSAGLKVGVHF